MLTVTDVGQRWLGRDGSKQEIAATVTRGAVRCSAWLGVRWSPETEQMIVLCGWLIAEADAEHALLVCVANDEEMMCASSISDWCWRVASDGKSTVVARRSDAEFIELGVEAGMRADNEAAGSMLDKVASENRDASSMAVVKRHGVVHAALPKDVGNNCDGCEQKNDCISLHTERARTPNDPKLSDGGAWRGSCVVERSESERA